MPSPAVIDAGPAVASITTPTVMEALRAENQRLRHALRHVLPALRAVHDDPCKPAQRVLLGEVINELTAAATEMGAGD
jgi:hypothetical protein